MNNIATNYEDYKEVVKASKTLLQYLSILGEECIVSDVFTLVTITFPNGIKNEVLKNKINRFMIDDKTLLLSHEYKNLMVLVNIIFSL